MAPEVVTDGHADPRSDIYSLGVVLFEAATGRLPFYGDSPYQLMRQHVDVEAPRARSAGARSAGGDRRRDRARAGQGSARSLRDRRGSWRARWPTTRPRRTTALVPRRRRRRRGAPASTAAAGWSTRPRSAPTAARRCCASSSSGRRRLRPGHRSRRDRRTSSTPAGTSRCTSCSTSFRPAPSRSRAGAAARRASRSTSPRGSRRGRPRRWCDACRRIGFDARIAHAVGRSRRRRSGEGLADD